MSNPYPLISRIRSWCHQSKSLALLDQFEVTRDCDWESGGCAPLALALLPLLPGSLPTAVAAHYNWGPHPHHLMLSHNGRLIDCRGSRAEGAVLKQWREDLGDSTHFIPLTKHKAWALGREWVGDELSPLVRIIRRRLILDILHERE